LRKFFTSVRMAEGFLGLAEFMAAKAVFAVSGNVGEPHSMCPSEDKLRDGLEA
jgi:hypothetical protein